MRRMTIVLAVSGLVAVAWIGPSIAEPPATCFDQQTNDNRTTDEADFLTGTVGDDVASLGQGGDNYFGTLGDDVLCGDAGDDVLGGEEGADQLDGGGNDDTLVGMGGADVLRGSNGSDSLNGGHGDDVIRAGPGDNAHDDLFDGPGSDTLFGSGEDTWHKCADGEADDTSAFTGNIVPDPDC